MYFSRSKKIEQKRKDSREDMMTRMREKVLTAFIYWGMLFLILGCKTQQQSKETIPSPQEPRYTKIESRKLMSTSTYKLSISSKNNALINCKGEGVIIDLYTDESIDIRGMADCGLLASFVGQRNVNLSDATATVEQTDKSKFKNSNLYGIVKRAPNPQKDDQGNVPEGGAYFDPPRPHILNPMLDIKTLNEFAAKKDGYSENSQITVGTPSGQITDFGTITVKLNEISDKIPYGISSSVAPLSTDKSNKGRVLNYTISSSGFNSIEKKGVYMLHDKRQMWMGTSPVVIYKMELTSLMKDLVDLSEGSSASGWLASVFDIPVVGSIVNLFKTITQSKLPESSLTIRFLLTKYEPVQTENTDSLED